MSPTTIGPRLLNDVRETNCFDLTTTNFEHDRWLYSWEGKDAPRDFYLNKVVFKNGVLLDFVVNQWSILAGTTVSELITLFQLDPVKWKTSWIRLNRFQNQPLTFGLYNNYLVVGTQPLKNNIKLFSPVRTFKLLSEQPYWRQLQYFCSYRQFVSRFNIAHTFLTDRHKLTCKIDYQLQQNVYNRVEIQPIVTIDEAVIFVPYRTKIESNLSDLQHKVDMLNRITQQFIHITGTTWLAHDRDLLRRCLKDLLPTMGFQSCHNKNILEQNGQEFSRCVTILDVLRLLTSSYNYTAVNDSMRMTWLSNLLLKPKILSTTLQKYEYEQKQKQKQKQKYKQH
jgi:hypothetical protein